MDESWKSMARCADRPLDFMFPEERSRVDSKAFQAEVQTRREEFCWKCPVRTRCFEYGLSNPHSMAYGLWGGTTAKERFSMVQVRCKCGGTLDPFDLVGHRSLRCRGCQARARMGE